MGRPREPFTLYKRRAKHGFVWYWRQTVEGGNRTPGHPIRGADGKAIVSKGAARQYVVDLLAGKLPARAAIPAGPTLRQYTDTWWLPEHRYVAKRRKRPLSTLYVQTQRMFLTEYVWPTLGELPLSAITPGHVEDWLESLPTKHGVSATTANHVFGALRKVYREGTRRREIREDPTLGVDPLPEDRKKRGTLTIEEIGKLFASPDAVNAIWQGLALHYALNMLACVTGCRMGELQALQRQHVHVDTNTPWIDVRLAWRRSGELVAPKAGSFGQIDIAPRPAAVLREIMAESPHQEPTHLVFWGRNGSTPIGSRKILDVFGEALVRIGVPEVERKSRNLVFHGWRHTATTLHRQRGMADEKLQRLTRHKTARMLETYDGHAHTTDPVLLEAAKVAGSWLEGKA